ncbi:hypothetical protein D9M70_568230 [compost metagenome]
MRRREVGFAIHQHPQVHVDIVGWRPHQAHVRRHLALPVRPDQPQALSSIAGRARTGIGEGVAVEIDQGEHVVALARIGYVQGDRAAGEVHPGGRVKRIDDGGIGPAIFRRRDLARVGELVELGMGTGCRVVEGDPAVVGQLVQRIGVVERLTDELLLSVENVRLGRSTQQAE